MEVAAYVYAADQACSRGADDDARYGPRWRRRLHLAVPVRRPEFWRRHEVGDALVAALSFLTEDEFLFHFEELTIPAPAQRYFEFGGDWFGGTVEEVVLFSGGLDSLAGAAREALVVRQSSIVRYDPIPFLEKVAITEVKLPSTALEKYRVSLADEERVALEGLFRKGKAAARKLAHARILLLADAGQDDEDIASALAVSSRTVGRVRKRLVTEGFVAALDHKPQPPRPDKVKIKGNVEQELIRLACSDPPEGRGHWTLELLADELVALGLATSLSTETVRQSLKKTTSTRGSSRPGASRPRPTASTSGGWKT